MTPDGEREARDVRQEKDGTADGADPASMAVLLLLGRCWRIVMNEAQNVALAVNDYSVGFGRYTDNRLSADKGFNVPRIDIAV